MFEKHARAAHLWQRCLQCTHCAKSHRMLTAMQHVTCNCDFQMCIPNLVMLELLAWTPDAQWATGQSSMQGAAGGSQCRHHSRSDASWRCAFVTRKTKNRWHEVCSCVRMNSPSAFHRLFIQVARCAVSCRSGNASDWSKAGCVQCQRALVVRMC